jgi:hypothetical protein
MKLCIIIAKTKTKGIIEPKISILPLFVFSYKGIYMLKTILQILIERRKGLKEW